MIIQVLISHMPRRNAKEGIRGLKTNVRNAICHWLKIENPADVIIDILPTDAEDEVENPTRILVFMPEQPANVMVDIHNIAIAFIDSFEDPGGFEVYIDPVKTSESLPIYRRAYKSVVLEKEEGEA